MVGGCAALETCRYHDHDTTALRSEGRRRRPKSAFVTLLCASPRSTFDRPDGLGAELSALAHGHAMQEMHKESRHDRVLLHVASGMCRKRLLFGGALKFFYHRIIKFTGLTDTEKLFSTWKSQPHLWLKLLVMNLTEYEATMWLGLDTIPVKAMDIGFLCKPTPCVDASGNADLMLFRPDAVAYGKMLSELQTYPESAIHRLRWSDYDMSWLHHYFGPRLTHGLGTPMFDMGHLRRSLPPNETYLLHYTKKTKPYFKAHCQLLPLGSALPDTSKPSESYCSRQAIEGVSDYLWWRILLDGLRLVATASSIPPLDVLSEYGVRDPLQTFPARLLCKHWVRRFPRLAPWCVEW